MEKKTAVVFDEVLEAIDLFSTHNNSDLFTNQALTEKDLQRRAGLKTLFESWAGTSFPQFAQYLTLNYAKEKIASSKNSLSDKGNKVVHPSFIRMTSDEYDNEGDRLPINYNFSVTPFGNIIIATTGKGVCYLTFFKSDRNKALAGLKSEFPKASLFHQEDELQRAALDFITGAHHHAVTVPLHVKGTEDEYKVWEVLMNVPLGELVTYGEIARAIGDPRKAQDVGVALGDNHIAFLIPCHRVIKSTGELGQYHWGAKRKAAMIGWEAAKALSVLNTLK